MKIHCNGQMIPKYPASTCDFYKSDDFFFFFLYSLFVFDSCRHVNIWYIDDVRYSEHWSKISISVLKTAAGFRMQAPRWCLRRHKSYSQWNSGWGTLPSHGKCEALSRIDTNRYMVSVVFHNMKWNVMVWTQVINNCIYFYFPHIFEANVPVCDTLMQYNFGIIVSRHFSAFIWRMTVDLQIMALMWTDKI